MPVTENSFCQGSFSEIVGINLEHYPVSNYYLSIASKRLSPGDFSSIFQASEEIFSFYNGKFRESGVAAVEHPVEVALLLLGEWIPYALHSSHQAREWVCASLDRREFLQRHALSNIMGVDGDDKFARYFKLVLSRAFSRLRDSFASRNTLAHLLALLHDRIEDDARVLDGSFSPEALIKEVTSMYPFYDHVLVELLGNISYLKTRRIGGDSYTKAEYIRAMFFASLFALFIKGLDVFSNTVTIRDLKDKCTDGYVRSAAERQQDKLNEYFFYVNLLIDLGHPICDLLADVLFALSFPEEFQLYYNLYCQYLAQYDEKIDNILAFVRSTVGERGRFRIDLGGVYRAIRRMKRGFYERSLHAAFAPRIVIYVPRLEDKDDIVHLLSSSSFEPSFSSSGSSSERCNRPYTIHAQAGYTEMLVHLHSGVSLLFVVTDPDSAWKFSALEETLFSSDPFDVRNRDLLQQYLHAYALSLPKDAEAALNQLRMEPIRDLIQVTACVDDQNFVIFLPVDSCVLDLSVRLCTVLQRTSAFECVDPSQLMVTYAYAGKPLDFVHRVFHGWKYIVSLRDPPVDADTLCKQLSYFQFMDIIKTRNAQMLVERYLQNAQHSLPPRRLVA